MRNGYFVLAAVSVFIVLVVIFLPGGVASGQEPTPTRTATITAPAPYQVATFANVANSLDCPVGAPAGWMTVTPGAAWDFLCGQCFFTPAPTSTAAVTPWIGTGTPPVGCTPAANGTPIVNGTPPANSCVYFQTPTATITATPAPTVYFDTSVCSDNYYSSFSCNFIGSDKVTIHKVGSWTPNNWNLTLRVLGASGSQVNLYQDGTVKLCPTCTSKSMGWGFIDIGSGVFQTVGASPVAAVSTASTTIASGQTSKTILWSFFTTSTTYTGRDYDITIYLNGSQNSTPTPAPTQTGTPNPNYCASVQSVDSDLENNDVFSYSGFQVGATSCFDLGGPGFNVNAYDFGTLLNGFYQFFANDPQAWVAHICLQGLNIGVVKIMGMEISLHVFALVAGLGLLIRNMFIS